MTWWAFSAARASEAEWLRPAFMAYLKARGTDDADYASAELIFGELVGNVVRHAPGEIAVRIDWPEGLDARPVLTVADRGPGFRVRSELPADLLAESGRGLFLVRAFGEELRVEPNPGGGARVRVTLPLRRRPPSQPAAPPEDRGRSGERRGSSAGSALHDWTSGSPRLARLQ